MSDLFTGIGRALGIVPPRDSVTIETNRETGVSTRVTVRNGVTTRTRVYIDPRTRAISDTPPSLEQTIRNIRAEGIDVRVEDNPDAPRLQARSRGSSGGGRSSNGATGSNDGPIRFEDAPAPSEESQPRLEDDPNNAVRQGSRFTRDGESRTQSFNINNFRSEILENEVLSTHSYLVTFSPFRMGFKENEPLTEFITNKRNTLVLRCENVVLPAPALLEEENIRRYGYGPVEKVPYGVQFSDVTMTWLVDNRSEIINFFNQWMNTIVLHNSPNTLMNATAVRPSERGLTTGLDAYDPFELGYKDAYTNPIVRIYVYNKQNQTTTTYEMYDVFPLNIQAMNLSWADENETQKLSVTFAYTNMRVGAPQAQKLNRVVNVNFDSNRPALMEKIPLSEVNFGITDKASSPSSVSITTSVNASTPNATSASAPAPSAARPIPAGPATRTFVGPPAP